MLQKKQKADNEIDLKISSSSLSYLKKYNENSRLLSFTEMLKKS